MKTKRMCALLLALLLALLPAALAESDAWTCAGCGTENTGKFCTECGTPRPEPEPQGWTCPACGTENAGKFCVECGAARPEDDAWTCAYCGQRNKGQFCPNCGAPREDANAGSGRPEAPAQNGGFDSLVLLGDAVFDEPYEGVWECLGEARSLEDGRNGVFTRTIEDWGASDYLTTIADGMLWNYVVLDYTSIKRSAFTTEDGMTFTSSYNGREETFSLIVEGDRLYMQSDSFQVFKRSERASVAEQIRMDVEAALAAPRSDLVGGWRASKFLVSGEEQSLESKGLQAIEFFFSNDTFYQFFIFDDGSFEGGAASYTWDEGALSTGGTESECLLEAGALRFEFSSDWYFLFDRMAD